MSEPSGSVIYTPAGGTATPLARAHFRRNFVRLTTGAEFPSEESGPAIFVSLSDLPGSPKRYDLVSVAGEGDFEVADIARREAGGAWLYLLELA